MIRRLSSPEGGSSREYEIGTLKLPRAKRVTVLNLTFLAPRGYPEPDHLEQVM